MIKTGG